MLWLTSTFGIATQVVPQTVSFATPFSTCRIELQPSLGTSTCFSSFYKSGQQYEAIDGSSTTAQTPAIKTYE